MDFKYTSLLLLLLAISIENSKSFPNEGEDCVKKTQEEIKRQDKKYTGWEQANGYRTNKGLVYTVEERRSLGLEGLLPPRVLTQEQQLEGCVSNVQRLHQALDKYIYLRDLQDTNERLFYQCLIEKVSLMLPIVYTPTVGAACQNYGLIYRRPRGMFLSIDNQGRLEEVMRNWPNKDVRAIVVTDGERILGLGDLGANGMGIPVGKMAIYTAMGGIDPSHCLPVTLDVGTNNKMFLKEDSTYVGVQRQRVTGPEYEQFVDEFMTAVAKVFGRHTLVQFEDFATQNAFKFLARYRDQYTMFNDDIQGTAAVTVGGILAACRFTRTSLQDSRVLFVGAGQAGVGIANLIVTAMGGDPEDARKKIFFRRSNRLIVKGDEGTYNEDDDRRLFCHEVPEGADVTNLVNIIKWMKPNILIGVSGTKGLFTKEVLETMASVSERPVIFPLSNPTDNSECTAEEAYKYTQGKCLFASGSPFPPVQVGTSTRHPQQCNNAYIFPGVALAVTTARMSTVPEEVFLIAAKTLATDCTLQADYERGSLYPSLERLRQCTVDIATEIVRYAYQNKLATVLPQPEDIKTYILSQLYNPHYTDHHGHH